ncbi:MAG: PDDEXK nuclease domain-containing protein [Fibrobacteria bacterium]
MTDSTPTPAAFGELADLIQVRRERVARLVNSEVVDLYWELGRRISDKIKLEAWGRGTVNGLADYLASQAQGLRGFSASNLWRMRQFFETWEGAPQELATLLRELPWSSHLDILGKCKTSEEREFYLRLGVRERYSVRELKRAIETGTFERVLLAGAKLAAPMRELHPGAGGVFKDVYALEFVGVPAEHSEQDLRKALVHRLRDFLIELGRDFSFVGEEYPVQVGNRDGSIDLLFFHRELRCLVAIELKITEFKPEHMGQLDFYLEALDRKVKKAEENPSIGLLLCKTKDDEVVEFMLNRSKSPALVAEYRTRLPDKKLLQTKLHEFFELEEQRLSKGAADEND